MVSTLHTLPHLFLPRPMMWKHFVDEETGALTGEILIKVALLIGFETNHQTIKSAFKTVYEEERKQGCPL